MQVKEYLQALSDEGKIRVEKIGSGNWYWSFLSEEKKARERVLGELKEEHKRLQRGSEDLREKIEEAERERDNIGGIGGGRLEREELMTDHLKGKNEVETLQKELEGYSECDPVEVMKKKKDVEILRLRAERWTDNILMLEQYLMEVTGGNREALEGTRRMFYGEENVDGEGLREL